MDIPVRRALLSVSDKTGLAAASTTGDLGTMSAASSGLNLMSAQARWEPTEAISNIDTGRLPWGRAHHSAYRALLADASAEVLRLVGRDLDRAAAPQPASRRGMTLSAAE